MQGVACCEAKGDMVVVATLFSVHKCKAGIREGCVV